MILNIQESVRRINANTMPFLKRIYFVYLQGMMTETEGREKDSSKHWFTPKTAIMARAILGQSQLAGIPPGTAT